VVSVFLKEGRTFLFLKLDLFLRGELSLLEDYVNPSFLFQMVITVSVTHTIICTVMLNSFSVNLLFATDL